MPEAADDFRILPLAAADIHWLTALAREIWYQHYPGIITVKQIEYMLEQRYSPSRIRTEIDSGTACWIKLLVNGVLGGFASYETNRAQRAVKLDKLYVHGRFRRRGCGAALARHVEQAARTEGCDQVYLQVNRNNFDSIAAYKRFGFEVVEQVKTDIGGGFYMDDYLMSKPL
ncbi:MAG TPA: GNAT family N-acetyltransferase [Burkholderiales bacterium]|jgi:ribosomal protein S18 acetylase RimI-like enzyme|nr:GNAT family N-acetyltransferase [Burkholderiales bacterium]